MIKGVVTAASFRQGDLHEDNLSIEFKLEDGWSCTLTFSEENSYKILSHFDKNPGKKDPKILIRKEFVLHDHPGGGTLAPIALKILDDEDWIYKKEGEWCRWM